MAKPGTLTAGQTRDLRHSSLHLTLYSVLLALYFFVVLRYLTDWLKGLFHEHRVEYALVAIALMIIQAVGLESISYTILRLVRRKRS
jgi:cytochrome c biogenesis protein CcdA